MSKTFRILNIYYMFRHFEEVSMQELRNSLPGFSDKTFSRDLALLRRAGVPIRFSRRRNAFVLLSEDGTEHRGASLRPPDYPEGAKRRQYIDRLIRLMTIMDDIPCEDCDVWYKETFPDMSTRTMQRDFTALRDIGRGYRIYYKRSWEDPEYKDDKLPAGHYFYDEEW